MSDGFHVGRASSGQLAGAAPIRDRAFAKAAIREVSGQHFGLGIADLGELSLERFSDMRMQLLTLRLEKRLVRGVLHQRMLEGVGRIGWRAAAEDELGA